MKDHSAIDDELVGAELDSHLEARRRGDATSQSTSEALSTSGSELDALKAVVDQLDDLAQNANGDAGFPQQLGKYRMIRCIGRGGQSRAFLAFDPDLRREIVIKYYHHADSEIAREAVLTEARSLARVTSPYVAACYAVDRHGDTPYLVLDRVCGTSLADVITDGGLNVNQRIELVARLAEGLASVHAAGILHRDIKPGNIIVAHDGTPKLIDFGLARDCLDVEAVARQGTVGYMSPEQARGEWERVDQHSDIFSLGAVLYELLSGRPVYSAPNKAILLKLAQECQITPLQPARPGAPPAMIELCMKCLCQDPANRPASATELARDLRKCARRPRKRAMALALLLIIPLLVVAVGLSLNLKPPAGVKEGSSLPPVHDWEAVLETLAQGPNADEDVLSLRNDFEFNIRAGEEPLLCMQSHVAQEGDVTQFSLQAEEPCFVVVYSIEFDDARNVSEIARLFPNPNEDNHVSPGTWLDLPEFVADAGESFAWLYLLASTEPLEFEDVQVFDTPATFDEWQTEVRGYRRHNRLSELMLPYVVMPSDESK